MAQRRHHKRVFREIHITCKNEVLAVDGVTLDICQGGVFIITENLLPPKSIVNVELWLDGDSPLRCLGQVTWLNRGQVIHYPAGFGLQFLELPSASIECLDRFCFEQEQEGWAIPW